MWHIHIQLHKQILNAAGVNILLYKYEKTMYVPTHVFPSFLLHMELSVQKDLKHSSIDSPLFIYIVLNCNTSGNRGHLTFQTRMTWMGS